MLKLLSEKLARCESIEDKFGKELLETPEITHVLTRYGFSHLRRKSDHPKHIGMSVFNRGSHNIGVDHIRGRWVHKKDGKVMNSGYGADSLKFHLRHYGMTSAVRESLNLSEVQNHPTSDKYSYPGRGDKVSSNAMFSLGKIGGMEYEEVIPKNTLKKKRRRKSMEEFTGSQSLGDMHPQGVSPLSLRKLSKLLMNHSHNHPDEYELD